MAAGVAVELVHMATLVHDDLIDGAEFRRGRASAWSAYGPEAARATGDYLFARAFAELAATGDEHAVTLLADAALCLARGEAMQRRQAHDPGHDGRGLPRALRPEDREAVRGRVPARRGARVAALGTFGLALGIAFQITDDILDCAGETVETGKIAGVDLREGTPTLPLILAAREDEVVRRALAGGPLDGALVRVAATGALERGARDRARLRAPGAREPERRAAPRGARDAHPPRRPPRRMIRLGRISYVNMAPVFYRLEHEVEEVTGVPTELNERLVAGEIDLAPISSIEWARDAATAADPAAAVRLVGGRGRLDPARLARSRSSRCAASRSRRRARPRSS